MSVLGGLVFFREFIMADIITIENNIKKYLKDGIDKEKFLL